MSATANATSQTEDAITADMAANGDTGDNGDNGDSGRDGGRQAAPRNQTGQLSELLQQQIAQALEPIVDDFRDQMVETVRSQMEERLDLTQLRDAQTGQQGRQGRQGQEERQGRQADEDQESPGLLTRLYEWLAETTRKALDAVQSALGSLGREVRQYVIKIVGSALVALLRPVLKAAIRKAFESAQQQGRDKLASLGQSPAR